jgi:hypothetical protein
MFSGGFPKLKHSIPSHDTFSTVFRMIDPKALDAAFGRVLAQIAVLLGDGDVIAIDGKALRGARDKGQSARTRMMVSAYAARLRLTLATVAADPGGELEAALEVLGLIALKGKVVTADALHCNRRTVAAITEGGGDYCLALKANQDCLCLTRHLAAAPCLRSRRTETARARICRSASSEQVQEWTLPVRREARSNAAATCPSSRPDAPA